jgi:hypothetical protein
MADQRGAARPFLPQTPEQARQRDHAAGVPEPTRYEVQTREVKLCTYVVRANEGEVAAAAVTLGSNVISESETTEDMEVLEVRRLDPAHP